MTQATYTHKVSGGEVAIQVLVNGAERFWMNGKRIDRATALRKIGA